MISVTELTAMARTAFAAVKDAIERGKPSEARSWLRLMQDLQKLAEKEADGPAAGSPDPVAAATREHDRLKALVRSGRARPADHLALKAAREKLRELGDMLTPSAAMGGAINRRELAAT